MAPSHDVAIVGGGILGLATALALLRRTGASVLLLEKERDLARHQTGRNSGVIHSGLYYAPNSLRAQVCIEGRERLYRFCEEQGIPHRRYGKVVIATSEAEVQRLRALEERGCANGLEGLRRLTPLEIREIEPHATGIEGLFVSLTGVVDFREVAKRMAALAIEQGAEVLRATEVTAVNREGSVLRLITSHTELTARHLIACAGPQADRFARVCGLDPGVRIVPFRGEYLRLRAERSDLVRRLIYPVPDPAFPFLGVHFTRTIDGEVEVGPNALLSLSREATRRTDLRDAKDALIFPGLWRLMGRHWRVGWREWWRSRDPARMTTALRMLVPEIREEDLVPAPPGVRAQAMTRDGRLLDDFHIVEEPRMIHLINAPSPAATACLALADRLVDRAMAQFELPD